MIPSTTKLALLSGIVLILGDLVSSLPTRYIQTQNGNWNIDARVEDFVVVIIPTKELVDTGVNLIAVNTGAKDDNYRDSKPEKFPTRTASKLGFVLAEKSPYKVDLEKSTVPLSKVQAPVLENGKQEDLVGKKEVKQEMVVPSKTEAKTVKKELKINKEEKKQESAKKGEIFEWTLRGRGRIVINNKVNLVTVLSCVRVGDD